MDRGTGRYRPSSLTETLCVWPFSITQPPEQLPLPHAPHAVKSAAAALSCHGEAWVAPCALPWSVASLGVAAAASARALCTRLDLLSTAPPALW